MPRYVPHAKLRHSYSSTLVGQKISEGEKIAIISDLSHFKVDGELADFTSYGDRMLRVGSKAVVRIGRERIPGIVSNVTPLSRNGVYRSPCVSTMTQTINYAQV